MTTAWILGFIVGTVFGAPLGFGVVRGWQRLRALRAARTTVAPAEPEQVEEKFGHPHAPVPAIISRLPEVAYPLAWETWIDRSGPYAILVIRLTDLATEKTLEMQRVEIEQYTGVYHASYPTWADYYAAYSFLGGRAWNHFRDGVMAKTTDWARRAATAHGPARPDRTDYQLGSRP